MRDKVMRVGRLVKVMDSTDAKYNKVGVISAISGTAVFVKFPFSKAIMYRARHLKVVK